MSRFRLAPTICAATMIAAFVTSVAAQAPVELGKRNARSKYTLGHVFAAQEFPDGRVVASDTKEQVFRLVDFAKGDVGLIGKQGDDSDTYRTASVIVRLPGDSLGLYDPAGRKMLHVTPQATIARFVPLPTISNGRRVGTLLGADPSGSLYFSMPELPNASTKTLAGVASVTRFSVGADADEPQLTYRTRRADQLAVNGIMPYYYRDAVAVRADGLLARVVADTYQVVWVRDGKEAGRTGPLAYTPIPISEAEQQQIKDSIIDAFKAMTAGGRGGAPGGSATSGQAIKLGAIGDGNFVIRGGDAGGAMAAGMAAGAAAAGGGGGQRVVINGMDVTAAATGAGGTQVMTPGAINFADLPIGKFPETKPPILSTGVTALFDNAGNLWVARERAHGDAVPHYDVIAEGKGVIGHVNLPVGTRLVGFGKSSVFLAREEDGSDWLERYSMPKM